MKSGAQDELLFKYHCRRKLSNKIQNATFATCGCEPLFYDPDLLHEPAIKNQGGAFCSNCGENEAIVTLSNATITLPYFSASYAEFAASAMMGKYSSDYCTHRLQAIAAKVCGCLLPSSNDGTFMFHDGILKAAGQQQVHL